MQGTSKMKAEEAAITFIDLLQKGDGIGIVRYNNISGPDDVLLKVTAIDAPYDGPCQGRRKE